MTAKNTINYEQYVPDIQATLENIEGLLAQKGFDGALHHLVKLRASQINGCGFCVKMHTQEARADGETNERLDRLVVWRHVSDYTAAERIALAWTEALTIVLPDTDYVSLRQELLEHFSEEMISVLTSVIAMINLWNRLQVSKH